jgi:drug/metabolite transporter (DMT)-like permease
MSKQIENVKKIIDKIPGRFYLIIAILIFASSSSVISKLTQIGAENLINGQNPISFCNVLFAGNLVALICLICLYFKDLKPSNFAKISSKNFIYMTGVAILDGALVPSLFFSALAHTMVNNVVLISRIEPPLSLALAIFLLKEKVHRWVIIGAIISFLGVILTIVLQSPNEEIMKMGILQINRGNFYALAGAISLSLAITMSKVTLRNIPLSIFSCYKMFVGTLVFFVITILLFGWEHFSDIFAPVLWKWMLFYGVVIVVGGQTFWLLGLRKTSAAEVSFASSFSPILGVIAAYIIVQEIPTFAQYFGGMVIILGIFINQIALANLKTNRVKRKGKNFLVAQEMENTSFKGL